MNEHVLYKLLSRLGKRIYFPQGIVAQTEQSVGAKIKATAGVAYENGSLAVLNEISDDIERKAKIKRERAFSYAPVAGQTALRATWKNFLKSKNPFLDISLISNPIVTSGLTHGVSIVLQLMLDEGDTLITPDCFWENYQHIAKVVIGGKIKTFSMFDEEYKFNVNGLGKVLEEHLIQKKKAIILLNFPNNPTGYSIQKDEAKDLFEMLHQYAEKGLPILTITDDAYFGLFYEDNIYKQSLFAELSSLHKNVLAVKIDGATKELLSWGLRVGFLTFGCKDFPKEIIDTIEQKVKASIRSTVTSSSNLSQSLVLRALETDTITDSIETHRKNLEEKYLETKQALRVSAKKYPDSKIIPLPCNSGYFLSFRLDDESKADLIRRTILEEEDIALIAIDNMLRFTFSCVEKSDIKNIIETIYKYSQAV